MKMQFQKHDQFFVNPERPEPGLTATSASFLAALASQETNRLEQIVKSSTFYDVYIELLSGSAQPRLVQKGKDEAFLNELPATAARIGELRGFMAYVHEAVKERDRRVAYLANLSFEDWLELPENGQKKALVNAKSEMKRPEAPKKVEEVDTDWAKTQLSVKDLAHFLLLEAKASTLGVYIHPEGVLSEAKDDLAQKAVKPVGSTGSGRETTIQTYRPSVAPERVYDNYNRLQQSHRTWEAELNTLKAKIEIMAKNENLERNRRYREQLLDYEKELSAFQVQADRHNSLVKQIQTEYSDWILQQTEVLRNLKIVVPHELQSTYDYLAGLGRGQ